MEMIFLIHKYTDALKIVFNYKYLIISILGKMQLKSNFLCICVLKVINRFKSVDYKIHAACIYMLSVCIEKNEVFLECL